jgi:hypothetical protein
MIEQEQAERARELNPHREVHAVCAIASTSEEAAMIAQDILSMIGGEARMTFTNAQLDQLQKLLCRATNKANGR